MSVVLKRQDSTDGRGAATQLAWKLMRNMATTQLAFRLLGNMTV